MTAAEMTVHRTIVDKIAVDKLTVWTKTP
jgi:hypothetical protein